MVKSRINTALSEYASISVTSGIEDATPHRLIQMLM
ncbi:MAG: flagellar protein FliS, partial [Gammaproteobacteria bacterium]|nr:flagellar protein FliS [Gammaproteobacteria bacterium]